MDVEKRLVDERALFDVKHSKQIRTNNSNQLMDSTESEDTGVFSPEISKCGTSHSPNDKENVPDTPESEKTNLFSPYVNVSLQSRLVESVNSHGSKENTPPTNETPCITKCLEAIERRNVKRKNCFRDALNAETSDDDSSNLNVEDDIFNDLEKLEPNKKRTKRFRFNLDELTNSSTSDDTGVGSSSSQEEYQSKRKMGFVVSNIQENNDSTYSEIPVADNKTTRTSRFVAPSSCHESDDSLSITGMFKSSTKNKRSNSNFKVPKSPAKSQDSARYSDAFKPLSPDKKKPNRKQENDDSLSYSAVFKPTSKDKKAKRKPGFSAPSCSQDTDDSSQYSEIFESTLKRVNRFAPPAVQSSEDSLNYYNISVDRQKKNNKRRFDDPPSQETDDSQGYSDISFPQNETNAEKNPPFVDPISQEVEGSRRYSDIPVSQGQNISTENSYGNEQQKCEKTNSTVSTSVRSICIDTYRSIRSSLNGSEPFFNSEPANKPFNQTYDVSTSAICRRQEDCSPVNVAVPNNILDEKTVDSSSYEAMVLSLNTSNECTLVNSNAEESVTLFESKNEDSNIQGSIPMTDESKQESATVEESISMNDDGSKLESNTFEESTSMNDGSKLESNIVEESILMNDESKQESAIVQESILMNDGSKLETATVEESISMNDGSKQVSATVEESILMNDGSRLESNTVQESIPVTDESKIQNFDASVNKNTNLRKSVSGSENMFNSAENSKHGLEKVVEPNATLAASLSNTLLNSIANSSTLPSPSKEIVEESVYVAFNPSSLMISVTELVDASSNCAVTNKSHQLEESAVSNEVHSNENEISPENIKEHNYALAQISNTENSVVIPSAEEIPNPSMNRDSEETSKEPAPKEVPERHEIVSNDIPCPKEIASIVVSFTENQSKPDDVLSTTSIVEPTSNNEQISKKTPSIEVSSAGNQSKPDDVLSTTSIEEPTSNNEQISKKTPSIEVSSARNQSKPDHVSVVEPTSNDEQVPKKTPSPNISVQSANYSLRKRKSRTSLSGEPNTPSGKKHPSVIVDKSNKSAASISPNSVTQRLEEFVASNDLTPKSNYSLRTKKSRSSGTQKSQEPVPSTSADSYAKKSPEPVPSTSAAVFNNHPVDDTGDVFFNSLESLDDIPPRNSTGITSSAESYSSHSRNSTSQTLVSKSSVSVFSISKIGRRPSVRKDKEFKEPEVPKVVPKKRNRGDPNFKHLPSRPNFPRFDSFCNKRFYDYITGKMEPKYGIRTNNKAVEMAKYLSEVVKEVIAMKTGEHHILIEEMKKMLFKAGIVTTHYNFYMFCFDYMPAWFRRKAIPMMQPVNCPPNVQFDSSLLFMSIG